MAIRIRIDGCSWDYRHCNTQKADDSRSSMARKRCLGAVDSIHMRRVKRRASIVICLANAEKETREAEKSARLQVVLLDTCSPIVDDYTRYART